MIEMKKTLFYPLWKADELENRLHSFELEGWRLKSITYSCVFNFVKSKPKNSDYIITYDMAKDRTQCMYEYEQMLLTDHSANKIQTKFTAFDVFRVTGKNREYNDLKNYRRSYFKHVLFQHMLISAIFLIIGICLIFAAILQQASGSVILLTCIYIFISALNFSYRMYGYIKQVLKDKAN